MTGAIRTLVLPLAAALFCSMTQPIRAEGDDQLAAVGIPAWRFDLGLLMIDRNTTSMNSLAPAETQPTTNQGGHPAPAQTDAGQSSSFQGKYIRKDKTSDFMVLGPDGVFTLFLGGKLYGGTYNIEGDALSVTGPKINRHLRETQITGNTIRDPLGTLWEKQGGPVPTSAPSTPVAPPPPPPPPQRVYEDVAPPPPPPAPAPTISMGQTKTQVIAAFGEPQRKAAAGPKEIFLYTDLKMKVTFTNGKVSGIE